MSKFKNITIIGTSHISPESVKKVKDKIEKIKPDIIALELDKARFRALLTQKRSSLLGSLFQFGFRGFLLNLIGVYVEKKLGKITNTKPGSEMVEAIKLAQKYKIKIALIDQPINITIGRLTSNITRKEKFQFLKDLFSRRRVKFDLNKVPAEKVVEKLLEEVKSSYPTVYRVLVEERNVFMAKSLYKILSRFPSKKVVVIVGAGHKKAILGELKSIKN